MTTDEMRIAIAEHMGRKPGEYFCSHCNAVADIESVTSGGFHDVCHHQVKYGCPALTLDWMHEVEKTLGDAERCVYAETLCAILKGAIVDWGYYPGESEIDWHSISSLIFATAEQRAEAYLRTIGKWKDPQ